MHCNAAGSAVRQVQLTRVLRWCSEHLFSLRGRLHVVYVIIPVGYDRYDGRRTGTAAVGLQHGRPSLSGFTAPRLNVLMSVNGLLT